MSHEKEFLQDQEMIDVHLKKFNNIKSKIQFWLVT